MKPVLKITKIISIVLLAIAVLCVCGFIVMSVTARRYQSREGTYVRRAVNNDLYGSNDPISSTLRLFNYERKDIVKITRNGEGYDICYIISVDEERRGSDTDYDGMYYDTYYNGEMKDDGIDNNDNNNSQSVLFTSDDLYEEYHGFISEKTAAEGGIVECRDRVTGVTDYLGVYFSDNHICIMDSMRFRVADKNGNFLTRMAGDMDFDKDGGYTFKEMFSVPETEREYWIIPGGYAYICEKTGLNEYAVLRLIQSIFGTAAAALAALGSVLAAVCGRRRTAAVSAALLAAAAVTAFVVIPKTSIAGSYADTRNHGYYLSEGLMDMAFGSSSEWSKYENIDIAPVGDNEYIVLFSIAELSDYITVAKANRNGELTLEPYMGFNTNEMSVKPSTDGLKVIGMGKKADTLSEYDRVAPAGFNMRLRYFILLSFALSFVVLLIVSARRRSYMKAHPIIPYGSYKIVDLLYLDGGLEYMRDYMQKSWRGAKIRLSADSFSVDKDASDISGYAPERENNRKLLERALDMRGGILVRPIGLSDSGAQSLGTKYGIIFDKKRRALVYSVEERPIAAFRLRPDKA